MYMAREKQPDTATLAMQPAPADLPARAGRHYFKLQRADIGWEFQKRNYISQEETRQMVYPASNLVAVIQSWAEDN